MGAIAVAIVFWRHWLHTPWRDLLFYDGDNITLALVAQSIERGEPFAWVFSSQSFLFPESLFFALSYWIAGEPIQALLINAGVNFLALFVLMALLSRSVFLKSESVSQSESIWAIRAQTIFFIIVSLALSLEAQPDVNGFTVLSLVGLSTYYVGAILVALTQLGMLAVAWRTDYPPSRIWAIAFIAIGALAFASNPLFLLQAMLPMGLLGLLFFWHARFRAHGKALMLWIGLSLVLGLGIRMATGFLTVASPLGYVHVDQVVTAVTYLGALIQNLSWGSPYGWWWVGLLGLWLLQCFYCVRHWRQWQSDLEGARLLLVHGFLCAAPIVTMITVVMSGNMYTRYFLPVPVCIGMGASLAIADYQRQLQQPFQFAQRIAALLAFSLGGIAMFFQNSDAWENSNYAASVRCYETMAQTHELRAIAGYWDARYLTLHSSERLKVMQVREDLRPYHWLSNRYVQNDIPMNAVIVSHLQKSGHLTLHDVRVLGEPSALLQCPLFDVYFFSRDTLGFEIINTRINQ